MEFKVVDVLGALGVLVLTVILSFIAKRLDRVLNNQTTQTTDIAVIKNDLSNMNSLVTSLHEWRTRRQEDELKDLKKVIEDYKHKEQ